MKNRPRLFITKVVTDGNQEVPSLKKLALNSFASSKQAFFEPSDKEYETLMAIRSNSDPLANNIKTEIEVLLQHIAFGQQAEAEKMIDESPYLLLLSGTVVDYSGRIIHDVTPLQLAFGAEDEVMAAMLIEKLSAHLEKAEGGRKLKDEIEAQINEKFPEDLIEDEIFNFDKLVAAIEDPNANITAELNHEPNQSALRSELDHFRKTFAPGNITVGKHFNMRHYFKALAVYDAHYEDWSLDQCKLFWRLVIGYLQRLIPVSYAQAGCQGAKKVEKGVPLARSLTLSDGSTYYPLDANPKKRLGYDHAVCFSTSATPAPAPLLVGNNMENLYNVKNSILASSCYRVEKKTHLRK